MQKGQIVASSEAAYRLRRDYGETVELVNSSGYEEAPAEQVRPVVKADGTPLTYDDLKEQ